MDRWIDRGYLYAISRNALERHNHTAEECCGEAVVDALVESRACGNPTQIAAQTGEIAALKNQVDLLTTRLSQSKNMSQRRDTIESVVILVVIALTIALLVVAVGDLGPFGPR